MQRRGRYRSEVIIIQVFAVQLPKTQTSVRPTTSLSLGIDVYGLGIGILSASVWAPPWHYLDDSFTLAYR